MIFQKPVMYVSRQKLRLEAAKVLSRPRLDVLMPRLGVASVSVLWPLSYDTISLFITFIHSSYTWFSDCPASASSRLPRPRPRSRENCLTHITVKNKTNRLPGQHDHMGLTCPDHLASSYLDKAVMSRSTGVVATEAEIRKRHKYTFVADSTIT